MQDIGIQRSTTRGISLPLPYLSSSCGTFPKRHFRYIEIPLSTAKSFEACSSIEDVILNESIDGWSVIFHLIIAVRKTRATPLEKAGEDGQAEAPEGTAMKALRTSGAIELRVVFEVGSIFVDILDSIFRS